MLKQASLLILVILGLSSMLSSNAQNIKHPILAITDMEQHSSFIANDLNNSPLLKSMFNLSAYPVNGNFIKICLKTNNQCKTVPKNAKVYLVSNNGSTKFDDLAN